MGARRIVWHVGFGRLLRRQGPSSFEVREEVFLSEEPPRMDYLLLRKVSAGIATVPARTLRRLWPLLPRISVVEYKSPGRPYRTGNLDRLWAYVHLYFADDSTRPGKRRDLAAVLVVPRRTPSLDNDVAEMGLPWEDLTGGYWRVRGGLFTLYVVEIDVVAPEEGDDLLYSLGTGKLSTPEARRFWMELVGSQEAGMSMQDMEGYDELMAKLLDTLPPEQVLSHYAPEQRLAGLPPEQRLAGLPPEQRLAGLPPEQRMAGLDRDHQALALPIEVLRLLPEQYLRSLSPEVQEQIERRLRRGGD
jgi:hypothetical protein